MIQTASQNTPQAVLLDPRQTAIYLGISKASLYRLVAAGKLPAPRVIVKRKTGWLRTELDTFVANLPMSKRMAGVAA